MSNTVMHKFAICILQMENVTPANRLWAVCKEEFLDAGLFRRFAVAQAMMLRDHVKAKKTFDSILEVCTRFSWGKATQAELSVAERRAYSASAAASAKSAAYFAAYSAASAANSAAGAARSAANNAAYSSACEMLVTMTKEYYSK